MEVERSLFVIIVVPSFTWGREVRGSRTADARSSIETIPDTATTSTTSASLR